MLARSPRAVFPALSPEGYTPHALHASTRHWPETNCYVDLWIELLHAIGQDPARALGFTAAQDFEGDQFTFFKFPTEDLALLFGVEVQELAIYDTLEGHVLEQIDRGRLALVEVDSFFLPDTRGITYRAEHGKTTIGINRLDPARRHMDYFHNGGFFHLTDEDYEGLFRIGAEGDLPLFPYVELVKFDRLSALPDPLDAARTLMRKHLSRRPTRNPIAGFKTRIGEQAFAASLKAPTFAHKYAFNTLRQLGANFELLSSHLAWLAGLGEAGLDDAIAAAEAIAAGAKVMQFQMMRAVARQKFDGLEKQLDAMVGAHDRALDALVARYMG